tara:strand:+ start:43 stop:777 length:735 start_codon:yes stop_codon:yes gene_type:complete
MSDFKFPTEQVDLPSNGLVYPKDNPLSSGKVEMKYMTAKEEDILTNQSYIERGTVMDKLLQSLIIDKSINYKDIIVGDKNAMLVAARVLGYGSDYQFEYRGEQESVDLSLLENRIFEGDNLVKQNANEFSYELPRTKQKINYKILTGRDEEKIEAELNGFRKINKNAIPELSTRLKYMITSVGDDPDKKSIREFVDNYLLASDSRAFRSHVKNTQPDVDLTFFPQGSNISVEIPIGIKFFWPDI